MYSTLNSCKLVIILDMHHMRNNTDGLKFNPLYNVRSCENLSYEEG